MQKQEHTRHEAEPSGSCLALGVRELVSVAVRTTLPPRRHLLPRVTHPSHLRLDDVALNRVDVALDGDAQLHLDGDDFDLVAEGLGGEDIGADFPDRGVGVVDHDQLASLLHGREELAPAGLVSLRELAWIEVVQAVFMKNWSALTTTAWGRLVSM